jgi:hypothetical protein
VGGFDFNFAAERLIQRKTPKKACSAYCRA